MVRRSPSLTASLVAKVRHAGKSHGRGSWYRSSILPALWDLSPERFTSQAFWDAVHAFEQILPEAEQDLPLEQRWPRSG